MVILDTNIIIHHLRQPHTESLLMRLSKEYARNQLGLSIVSVQELYEGKSTRESEKEHYLLATISPLTIVSYTYEIAQLAGEIARDRKQSIELADAAIAASAILHGAQLATLNTSDFRFIPSLELLDLTAYTS